MKKIIGILLTAVLASPFGYLNAAQPQLGKYPKMFGADNYVVTMLRVGEDDSSVLIKVDGIDNQFDGQIFLHKKLCDNTACTNYKYETTEIPGKKRWWTIQSTRSWGSYDDMKFFPPGIDKKHSLSEGRRPEKFDPNSFYQEYLGQKALRN